MPKHKGAQPIISIIKLHVSYNKHTTILCIVLKMFNPLFGLVVINLQHNVPSTRAIKFYFHHLLPQFQAKSITNIDATF